MDVADRLVHRGEGQRNAGVGGAIVQGDAAGFGVGKGGAGEHHVRHVPEAFIRFMGCQKEAVRTVQDFPRLVLVQKRRTHAVGEAVAAGENAVVEQQPSLVRFNGCGTCANLGHFPVFHGSHDETVLTPVGQIPAVAKKNVAVGGVSPVAGTNKQNIFPIYFQS